MKKTYLMIGGALLMLAGAAVIFFKKKRRYGVLEEFKVNFSDKEEEKPSEPEKEEEKKPEDIKPAPMTEEMKEYCKQVKKYAKGDIVIFEEGEYESDSDYDLIELHVNAEYSVFDDDENELLDIAGTIGEDCFEYLMHPGDIVYVRNERLRVDYKLVYDGEDDG